MFPDERRFQGVFRVYSGGAIIFRSYSAYSRDISERACQPLLYEHFVFSYECLVCRTLQVWLQRSLRSEWDIDATTIRFVSGGSFIIAALFQTSPWIELACVFCNSGQLCNRSNGSCVINTRPDRTDHLMHHCHAGFGLAAIVAGTNPIGHPPPSRYHADRLADYLGQKGPNASRNASGVLASVRRSRTVPA